MTPTGAAFLAEINPADRILSAAEVGEAAIKVLERGDTASVWYINKSGDEPWEVPDPNTMENLMACSPGKKN